MTTNEFTAWLGDGAGLPRADELTRALDALMAGPPREATHRAGAALQARLKSVAPATIWYGSTPRTWVGKVWVAVSERGLAAVDFGVSEGDFVAGIRRRHRGPIRPSPEKTAAAARQIYEYLAGRRSTFDLPLDLSGLPDFQRRVLLAALEIPRGRVITYGEIARRVGRPKASRAAGQALGHNPMPIVIPCHRVLGADGALHGYGGAGGLKTKERLLKLEGAL